MADEPLATLGGLALQPMSEAELSDVVGAGNAWGSSRYYSTYLDYNYGDDAATDNYSVGDEYTARPVTGTWNGIRSNTGRNARFNGETG